MTLAPFTADHEAVAAGQPAAITSNHSFKSPAIAAAIARYSLLRHGAAIYVHIQFNRYVPL
jgi:hypothetical protein